MRSSRVHERTDFVLLLWLVAVLVMLGLHCWVFKRFSLFFIHNSGVYRGTSSEIIRYISLQIDV